MPIIKKINIKWCFVVWLAFGAFALFATPASAAVYPDGSLLKSLDDTRVYIVENGQKRWVESEATLLEQGFTLNDVVTVSPYVLDLYDEGSAVKPSDQLSLPLSNDILPDLIPLPINEVRFDTVSGQEVLRFSGIFWNQGPGDLAVRTNLTGDEQAAVAEQVIDQQTGGTRLHTTGTLFFHDLHGHFHLNDFGLYTLKSAEDKNDTIKSQAKVSFCFRDDRLIDSSVPDASLFQQYGGCYKEEQGVSVGWADVYRYTLEDQYVSLDGVESGAYQLIFHVDPNALLQETTHQNNRSVVLIDLNRENHTIHILASISPKSPSNVFVEDGLVLAGDESTRLYLTHDGGKRMVSASALVSYGLTVNDVLTIPEEALQAIPNTEFVKTVDGKVFRLNEHGYVRHILNPEVLSSYKTSNIPLVTPEEFETYRITEFIRKEGSQQIYSTNSKQLVGFDWQLAQLSVDPLAVQSVNETDFMSYVVATVRTDLDVPWDIAFLPNGDMLVTERPGTLRRFGSINTSMQVPGAYEYGETGLLGIAVHPNFTQNQLIYLYYAIQADGLVNEIGQFRLDGGTLTKQAVILSDIPGAIYHDGGQLAFGPDGNLYITTGDARNGETAQDLASLSGKTLRLTADGAVPSDNPFANAVYSYGHRNVQGMAWDEDGRLWEVEHGPTLSGSGFDEINLVRSAGNYGWPEIRGDEDQAGLLKPKLHSGPNQADTWAPAGVAFYDGKLYVTGLYGSKLLRVTLQGEDVRRVDDFFDDQYGRMRAATIGPDGMLYISTSNRDGRGTVRAEDDRILKIAPGMLEGL